MDSNSRFEGQEGKKESGYYVPRAYRDIYTNKILTASQPAVKRLGWTCSLCYARKSPFIPAKNQFANTGFRAPVSRHRDLPANSF